MLALQLVAVRQWSWHQLLALVHDWHFHVQLFSVPLDRGNLSHNRHVHDLFQRLDLLLSDCCAIGMCTAGVQAVWLHLVRVLSKSAYVRDRAIHPGTRPASGPDFMIRLIGLVVGLVLQAVTGVGVLRCRNRSRGISLGTCAICSTIRSETRSHLITFAISAVCSTAINGTGKPTCGASAVVCSFETRAPASWLTHPRSCQCDGPARPQLCSALKRSRTGA